MGFDFDQNRHVANRVGQEAEIKEQARKEKNRLEIPNEEDRNKEDYSFEAQRKKQVFRNVTGIVAILAIFYIIYWFATRLF